MVDEIITDETGAAVGKFMMQPNAADFQHAFTAMFAQAGIAEFTPELLKQLNVSLHANGSWRKHRASGQVRSDYLDTVWQLKPSDRLQEVVMRLPQSNIDLSTYQLSLRGNKNLTSDNIDPALLYVSFDSKQPDGFVYWVLDPEGKIATDVITIAELINQSGDVEQARAPTAPLTLATLQPYLLQILKLTTERGHTVGLSPHAGSQSDWSEARRRGTQAAAGAGFAGVGLTVFAEYELGLLGIGAITGASAASGVGLLVALATYCAAEHGKAKSVDFEQALTAAAQLLKNGDRVAAAEKLDTVLTQSSLSQWFRNFFITKDQQILSHLFRGVSAESSSAADRADDPATQFSQYRQGLGISSSAQTSFITLMMQLQLLRLAVEAKTDAAWLKQLKLTRARAIAQAAGFIGRTQVGRSLTLSFYQKVVALMNGITQKMSLLRDITHADPRQHAEINTQLNKMVNEFLSVDTLYLLHSLGRDGERLEVFTLFLQALLLTQAEYTDSTVLEVDTTNYLVSSLLVDSAQVDSSTPITIQLLVAKLAQCCQRLQSYRDRYSDKDSAHEPLDKIEKLSVWLMVSLIDQDHTTLEQTIALATQLKVPDTSSLVGRLYQSLVDQITFMQTLPLALRGEAMTLIDWLHCLESNASFSALADPDSGDTQLHALVRLPKLTEAAEDVAVVQRIAKQLRDLVTTRNAAHETPLVILRTTTDPYQLASLLVHPQLPVASKSKLLTLRQRLHYLATALYSACIKQSDLEVLARVTPSLTQSQLAALAAELLATVSDGSVIDSTPAYQRHAEAWQQQFSNLHGDVATLTLPTLQQPTIDGCELVGNHPALLEQLERLSVRPNRLQAGMPYSNLHTLLTTPDSSHSLAVVRQLASLSGRPLITLSCLDNSITIEAIAELLRYAQQQQNLMIALVDVEGWSKAFLAGLQSLIAKIDPEADVAILVTATDIGQLDPAFTSHSFAEVIHLAAVLDPEQVQTVKATILAGLQISECGLYVDPELAGELTSSNGLQLMDACDSLDLKRIEVALQTFIADLLRTKPHDNHVVLLTLDDINHILQREQRKFNRSIRTPLQHYITRNQVRLFPATAPAGSYQVSDSKLLPVVFDAVTTASHEPVIPASAYRGAAVATLVGTGFFSGTSPYFAGSDTIRDHQQQASDASAQLSGPR